MFTKLKKSIIAVAALISVLFLSLSACSEKEGPGQQVFEELSTLWVEQQGIEKDLQRVIWDGSRFIALGAGVVAVSEDGIQWEKALETDDGMYKDIAYNDTIYVVVGSEMNNAVIRTSQDLENWTSPQVPAGVTFFSKVINTVAYDGSKFFIPSDTGNLITSNDGASWNVFRNKDDIIVLLPGIFPNRLIWEGKKLFLAGSGGVVAVSSDGLKWDEKDTGSPDDINCIVKGKTGYAAGGDTGIIAVSEKGTSWEIANNPLEDWGSPISDIIWDGSSYLAVCPTGGLMTSRDGETWVMDVNFPLEIIYSIAYNDKRYVVVGQSGKIFTKDIE